MEVKISKLIGLKISLEGYFIMYSIYNEEKDLLMTYMKNVKPISSEVFLDLITSGYLINNSINPNLYDIENLELTDKFKDEVLKVPKTKGINFEEAFQQLREHYPSKVTDPANNGIRRLQQDIDRCKKLYRTAILVAGEVDEAKHSLILQCINFEKNERKRSRSEMYWKLLPTYLSKRAWDVYEEEVERLINKNGSVQATESGFQEDI